MRPGVDASPGCLPENSASWSTQLPRSGRSNRYSSNATPPALRAALIQAVATCRSPANGCFLFFGGIVPSSNRSKTFFQGCQFRRRGSRGPQVVERNSPFRIVRAVAADAVGFDQRLDVACVRGRPIRRLFGRARWNDRQPDRECHQMHPEQEPTRGRARRFCFFVAHGRVFNGKKSAPAAAATWTVRARTGCGT